MSWILGFMAMGCFGWAATLVWLIRTMEERDNALDMCEILMARKNTGGDEHGNRSAD